MGEILVRKRKWALLAVLLGMMVVISGCFGGGTIKETGRVTGVVCVPKGENASPEKPVSLSLKGLAVLPEGYRPLEGASVEIGGRVTTTDASGSFELWGIPVGTNRVRITYSSPKEPYYTYEPYSTTVTVYANETTELSESPIKLGVGYYLLIGVGNFDPTVPVTSLDQGPENDVRMMEIALAYDLLWLGDYVTLIDSQATKENVQRNLDILMNRMQDNDFLVIYFSGHGMGGDKEDYDRDAIMLFDDLLTDVELEAQIGSSLLIPYSNRVTLILDACHSGSFADGIDRNPPYPYLPKAFKNPRYTVLTSSERNMESDQADFGSPDQFNGAFTYHLVKGFLTKEADYNQDGTITATEARRYVDQEISSLEKLELDQKVFLYPANSPARIFQYK